MRSKIREFFKDLWTKKEQVKVRKEEAVLEEIKHFFLEAALNTYAADALKDTIPSLPKSKVYFYEKGEFIYADIYFSSGKKSMGSTLIWHQGEPVWGMQYYGSWEGDDGRVIPFLKRVLKRAYASGQFFGGRGPEVFEEGSLKYVNRQWRKDFKDFNGDDEIWEDQKLLFSHHYEGMALV